MNNFGIWNGMEKGLKDPTVLIQWLGKCVSFAILTSSPQERQAWGNAKGGRSSSLKVPHCHKNDSLSLFMSILSVHVPELISSCRFEAPQALMQVSFSLWETSRWLLCLFSFFLPSLPLRQVSKPLFIFFKNVLEQIHTSTARSGRWTHLQCLCWHSSWLWSIWLWLQVSSYLITLIPESKISQ